MTNPRSESIALSRSNETRPIRSGVDDDGSARKVDHYAYVGRVISAGVEEMLTDGTTNAYDGIHDVESLHRNIRNGIYDHILLALKTPEFKSIAHHLEASQAVRHSQSDRLYDDVYMTFLSGISTYVSSAEGLYLALRDGMGVETASDQSAAHILDIIAKLHIKHFGPYKRVYLDNYLYLERERNRDAFTDQLEQTYRGLRFKDGFPEMALIPDIATAEEGLFSDIDYVLRGDETLHLHDIPTNQARIGCPFTFDPQLEREMWAVFSSHRHRIDLEERFGTDVLEISSGGIEASLQ